MDYLPIPCAKPTEWSLTPRAAANPVAYAAPLPAETLAPLKQRTKPIFTDDWLNFGWKVCGWVNAAGLAVAVLLVMAGVL